MSKAPSDATLLRQARYELKRVLAALKEEESKSRTFRARATQAEQELVEWKQRFDALLKILPEKP